MNQVSNWLDMSQIYNSRKKYFIDVNRDPNDHAKLLESAGDGGGFKYMPRCPVNNR